MGSVIAVKKLNHQTKDYTRLELAEIHKPMISEIGQIIGKFIPIPQMALTGFCWTALRIYQMEYNITIKSIGELPARQRVNIVATIFKILADILKDTFREIYDSPVIDSAILESFNYYQRFYGFR